MPINVCVLLDDDYTPIRSDTIGGVVSIRIADRVAAIVILDYREEGIHGFQETVLIRMQPAPELHNSVS